MTLVEPGATPRQVLRYHLAKGARVTSQLECDADIKSSELASAMPTQLLQLETTVDDVLADGSAKLRITVLDASVRERAQPAGAASKATATGQPAEPSASKPPTTPGEAATPPPSGDAAPAAHHAAASVGAAGAVAGGASGGKPAAPAPARTQPGEVSIDVLRAQVAAMRGVVITETLGPDGSISGAHVEPGASTDKIRGQLDGLLRNLAQVATRLPADPVGVGAMWRERRTLPEGGVRAVSEITYTLASLSGATIGFTSAGTSSADAQTVEQDGSKLEVSDTHGKANASGTVDLARYAIDVVASSTFATTMKVVAPAGSSDGKSTIEIAMTIRLASMPAATPVTATAPAAPAGDTPPGAAVPATRTPPPAAAPTGGPSTATDHGTH